jgi:hypothetical protein
MNNWSIKGVPAMIHWHVRWVLSNNTFLLHALSLSFHYKDRPDPKVQQTAIARVVSSSSTSPHELQSKKIIFP